MESRINQNTAANCFTIHIKYHIATIDLKWCIDIHIMFEDSNSLLTNTIYGIGDIHPMADTTQKYN